MSKKFKGNGWMKRSFTALSLVVTLVLSAAEPHVAWSQEPAAADAGDANQNQPAQDGAAEAAQPEPDAEAAKPAQPAAAAPAQPAQPTQPAVKTLSLTDGQYRVLQINPDWKGNSPQARKARQPYELKIRNIVAGTELLGTDNNRDIFQNWFKQYYFPVMTQPEQLSSLADQRVDFIVRHVQRTNNKEVHDLLVQLAMVYAPALMRGNFHPVVRYNAALIVGDLNAVEPVTNRVPRQPARPLAEALPILVQEYQNLDQADAVRLAAVIGIMRHVQTAENNPSYAIPAALKSTIRQEMLDLVRNKQAPPGRSSAGHVWFQRRAIDILAAMSRTAADGEVASTLANLVADQKADLSLRLTAAEALGQVNLGNANLKPADTAHKLGELAAVACRRELDRLEAERRREEAKKKLGVGGGGMDMAMGMGGMGGMGMGGEAMGGMEMEMPDMEMMGPGMGMGMGGSMGMGGPGMAPAEKPVDYKVTAARRRFKYRLASVQSGLGGENTGVAALAKADAAVAAQVTKVAQAVAGVMEATNQKDVDLKTLIDDVTSKLQLLETVVQSEAAGRGPTGAPTPDLPSDLPG